jgi:hypothetical protein
MQLRLQVRDEEGLEQTFKFFVFLGNLGLVCSQIAKIAYEPQHGYKGVKHSLLAKMKLVVFV